MSVASLSCFIWLLLKKLSQDFNSFLQECQRDLSSVIPTLIMATEALDTLDKAAISEIRVYTKPPFLVMTVMAAVCILLQKKPEWTVAKTLLGDPNFLKRLKQIDKDSLPDKVRRKWKLIENKFKVKNETKVQSLLEKKPNHVYFSLSLLDFLSFILINPIWITQVFHKLKKYSKNPDFNPDKVGTVSYACKSICAWVLALEHYNEVYKVRLSTVKHVIPCLYILVSLVLIWRLCENTALGYFLNCL